VDLASGDDELVGGVIADALGRIGGCRGGQEHDVVKLRFRRARRERVGGEGGLDLVGRAEQHRDVDVESLDHGRPDRGNDVGGLLVAREAHIAALDDR